MIAALFIVTKTEAPKCHKNGLLSHYLIILNTSSNKNILFNLGEELCSQYV